MAWVYEQASGRLSNPEGEVVGVGYSGQPPHKNVPADEGLPDLGPIPCGLWTRGEVIAEHPKLGPYVIVLVPDVATRARVIALGRDPDSFRMHGERVNPPFGFASDGCIIQIRTVRMMFGLSVDPDIQVVAQMDDTLSPSAV